MDKTRAYQFDDEYFPNISYKPTKEKKAVKAHSGTNTKKIIYDEAETNTDHPENSIEVQTEDVEIEQAEETEYDEERLGKFLKRSLPKVLQALIENETSQAFKNYDLFFDRMDSEVKTLYTLSNKENSLIQKENHLEITDVSWNATGLTIAAAYGKLEHEGMCYDRGYICAWNLNRRDFKHDSPNIKIETNGCIMCIEFHPTKPSILAGGSFNGEVYLWDLSQKDENLICYSKIDDYFHREAVSQIIWFGQKITGSAVLQYNILTISTDGKALIWEQENRLKYPTKGYSLVRKKDGNLSYVGALSISQSSEDKTCFILGTEAGSIFKLLLNNVNKDYKKAKVLLDAISKIFSINNQSANKEMRWREETEPVIFNIYSKNRQDIKEHVESYCQTRRLTDIKSDLIFQSKPDMRKLYSNPISFAYEVHYGPVYSVACSPFSSFFLSSSLDGTLKLFDTASNKPYQVFDHNNYIFKVGWSPSRPAVFAAASGGGEVLIYDLARNKKTPIVTLKNEDEKNLSVLTLEFNKVQTDLLAVAYSGCYIKIYQLNQMLCTPLTDEVHELYADS